MTLELPGRWETAAAVADSLADLVRFGFDDKYWDAFAGRVRGLSVKDLAATTDVFDPSHLVWVVVGDRAKIEKGLKDLGLGDPILVDADGNPAAAKKR
jgi:zinc protease